MARLLHAIPEAGEQLGVGRSTVYELIAAGALKTVKIGRRTLIPHAELERYVRGLATDANGDSADRGAA